MADDEHAPKTMLYPRDPSLDPQLMGEKHGQDARATQLNLFADFNGGPADFAQKIDFYHHEQNWSNRMILGDSPLVMTSLAEKEGLKGKVQTIYVDPPYGIKFGSNWQVSTRKRDVKDGNSRKIAKRASRVGTRPPATVQFRG